MNKGGYTINVNRKGSYITIMSTVNANIKTGHPVAGIVLGIAGMGVSLLMALLFGAVAGEVAAGLAIIFAVTTSCTSVNMMKTLRDTAKESSVAPHFVQCMENPYLGLVSSAANTANDKSLKDPVETVQTELDALNAYTAKT